MAGDMDDDDEEEEVTPMTSHKRARLSPSECPQSMTVCVVDPDHALHPAPEPANARPFHYYWPEHDQTIDETLTAATSTTFKSVMETAIAALPNPSRKVRALWGITVEPGFCQAPAMQQATWLKDTNGVVAWIDRTKNLATRYLFCVLKRAIPDRDDTPGPSGRANLDQDALFPAPAEMYQEIAEQSDDEAAAGCANPHNFPRTEKSFAVAIRKVKKRIIRQQRMLSLLETRARAYFSDGDERSWHQDPMEVTWLRDHDWIRNPPARGSRCFGYISAAAGAGVGNGGDDGGDGNDGGAGEGGA